MNQMDSNVVQRRKRSREESGPREVTSKVPKRTRGRKAVVKSPPPRTDAVKSKARAVDFSHVPSTDFVILDFETEPLEAVYETGAVIGEGQFGIVSEVVHRETGRFFACKSISKNTLFSQSDMDDVVRELKISAALQGCPHIVCFESVHEDDNWIHMVMELCDGGELFDEINRVSSFSESVSARIFHQIVKGVLYCHERGVLHHDLKPENILLSRTSCYEDGVPRVKLADFGLSVVLAPGEKIRGKSGSPFYMSPEVLDGMYGLSADVWSLGVILYILLSGSPPFFGDDDESTYSAIRENDLQFNGQAWKNVSEEVKSLIRSILNRDPSKRPSAYELLHHPWMVQHCYPPSSPSEICQSPDVAVSPKNDRESPRRGTSSSSSYHSEFKTPETRGVSRLQAPSSAWSHLPRPGIHPSPAMSCANSSISSLDIPPIISTYSDEDSGEEAIAYQCLLSESSSEESQQMTSQIPGIDFFSSSPPSLLVPRRKRSKRTISRTPGHFTSF